LSSLLVLAWGTLCSGGLAQYQLKWVLLILLPYRVQGLGHSINGRKLFSNLSFEMYPGTILGVIGPNGAGKTVFMRILVRLVSGNLLFRLFHSSTLRAHLQDGLLTPDEGTVHWGETVRRSMVGQIRHEALDMTETVHDAITEGHAEVRVLFAFSYALPRQAADTKQVDFGEFQMSTRQFVNAYHFRGPSQQRKLNDLSGGELNRVHLARAMIRFCFVSCASSQLTAPLFRRPNVILLDEPTNDLDVEVLRSLEDGLASFAGSIVIVSHDRWFLSRLANNILSFDGEGGHELYVGGYDEFIESAGERKGTWRKNLKLGMGMH
jgi:sulfate-transporting ATPase